MGVLLTVEEGWVLGMDGGDKAARLNGNVLELAFCVNEIDRNYISTLHEKMRVSVGVLGIVRCG